MEKKANILDWFYIIVVLLVTGVCIYAAHLIITNSNMRSLFVSEGVDDYVVKSENAILSFDNMMLFVIVGLSVFVLISSAVVFNHPAFFVIGFFMLVIAVILSAIISNTFWDISNTAMMAATASAFPKITFLMNNLPMYIAFMGIACMIAMYASYSRQ